MRVERIRIPKERVAPLIGKEGEVKERIEEELDVKIDIDSSEGMVKVSGKEENPLSTMTARDVITAIGRGFNPERAYKLFDDDFYLSVIDVTEYSGKSDKKKKRLKGRVIGRNGKTRKLIEKYTGTELSIYGKTVACIGVPEKVKIVREAVDKLLDGTPHSAVYRFLENKKEESEKPLELWK